jgi:hypothetical protein
MMQPMMRMGFLLLSTLGLLLPGCQRDDSKMSEKLDQVIKKQEQIIGLLEKGGGPGGARGGAGQRPQRPRPASTEVYAVPIEGAAWVGNKDAKVTIVEAFEFA